MDGGLSSFDNIEDLLVSPLPPPPQQLSSTADNPTMNRSTFEWELQQFVEQMSPTSDNPFGTLLSPRPEVLGDVAGLNQIGSHTSKPDIGNQQSVAAALAAINNPAGSSSLAIGSEEYRMFIACAAFAWTKARSAVGPGSSGPADLAGSHSGSRVLVQGSKDKGTGGSVAIPALPAGEKSVAQTNRSTSGSEQSDYDELDGENELAEDKRMRRKLSNREAAKRSRMKKQSLLDQLQSQVSELQAENSSLLKSLMDISTKYNEAAVEIRSLKANAEKMKEKFQAKIAEMSEICTTMPPYSGNTDTSRRTDVAE